MKRVSPSFPQSTPTPRYNQDCMYMYAQCMLSTLCVLRQRILTADEAHATREFELYVVVVVVVVVLPHLQAILVILPHRCWLETLGG